MQWWWIICFLPLAFFFYLDYIRKKNVRRAVTVIRKLRKNNREGAFSVTDIIKDFIGKDCCINTIDGQISGTVESVDDKWIVIVENGNKAVVNTEFVSRIREYPHNKKGKRKTVFE